MHEQHLICSYCESIVEQECHAKSVSCNMRTRLGDSYRQDKLQFSCMSTNAELQDVLAIVKKNAQTTMQAKDANAAECSCNSACSLLYGFSSQSTNQSINQSLHVSVMRHQQELMQTVSVVIKTINGSLLV